MTLWKRRKSCGSHISKTISNKKFHKSIGAKPLAQRWSLDLVVPEQDPRVSIFQVSQVICARQTRDFTYATLTESFSSYSLPCVIFLHLPNLLIDFRSTLLVWDSWIPSHPPHLHIRSQKTTLFLLNNGTKQYSSYTVLLSQPSFYT